MTDPVTELKRSRATGNETRNNYRSRQSLKELLAYAERELTAYRMTAAAYDQHGDKMIAMHAAIIASRLAALHEAAEKALTATDGLGWE